MNNDLVQCSKCGGRIRVVDKRNRAECIWRRRKCESCGSLGYSIEIPFDKDSNATVCLDIDMFRQGSAPEFVIKQNGVNIDASD